MLEEVKEFQHDVITQLGENTFIVHAIETLTQFRAIAVNEVCFGGLLPASSQGLKPKPI